MLQTIIIASVLTLLIAGSIAGLIYFFIARKKGILMRALNMKLYQITLPKAQLSQGQNFKELIGVAEHFYSILSKFKKSTFSALIYGEPHIAFEIANPAQEEEIIFYIAVSRRFADDLEKQIHGIFPNCSVVAVQDYNIFNPAGFTKGANITLKRDFYLPIKTYVGLEADPLNLLTSELSKLDKEEEGASLQILIRPVSQEWIESSRKIIQDMRGGMKYKHAVAKQSHKVLAFAGSVASEFDSSKKQGTNQPQFGNQGQKPMQQGGYHGEEEIIKALEEKQKKIAFETNIRIVASAPTEVRAQEIVQYLGNAFSQYTRMDGNEFYVNKQTGNALKEFIYKYTFRIFDSGQAIVLNTEELASLYHFSTAKLETPRVRIIKSKVAPPPANLPAEGISIGFNDYRGIKTDIKMSVSDRRRHIYIIGQTGTGKSSIMQHMILQDIQKGNGVGIVDPHGEFVEYVLNRIPKERAEDLVLFEPSDMQRPFGLNMLEYDPNFPEQKTFVVNELMKIFDRLYDLKATGGPMFEQYTRNAMLLLMDDPNEQATIMDIPRVMSDSAFRKRLLEKCKNIIVHSFWTKEAEKAGGEASLANFVPYITSKFNVFIANDYMRPIIGQPKTTLNFQDILNNKKILLVNLSKGRLGDINSNLLGMIVIGKLTMAAFSRVNIPEEQRNDFYLYMDEFQNFATDSIATILSEARKYRLCLTMAHQYIGQLPDDIKNAVFGNVGSMVVYRVGADDAQFLSKQFAPVFDESDLANIDNFHAHVKMLMNNLTTAPFNIGFPNPKNIPANEQAGQFMRELSRLKYGRDRELVEEEIIRKYRGTI